MDLIKELDKAGENKDQIIATELLVTAKATVRTYAVALTETASPEVRDVLKRQLRQAIDQHGRIADYMMENDMYYAHDIDKQLKLDKKKVKAAKQLVKKK
ncbi:spore coat protein [Lacicoccus alkaliphilus]|uniref:Similar to spore coat protein n=1 Tax=Lacicoccus alkaliphilus DSM 16010 TaxID=1123231 RepID=A0A1M7JJX6_9BACL|nr:spore coat protein [Salinicoccus alkaliphilus]SHM53380.1 similar to spore coat protein [Salinicoccus alkaliphilus DSM 16010]